jgi:hypothetical protein
MFGLFLILQRIEEEFQLYRQKPMAKRKFNAEESSLKKQSSEEDEFSKREEDSGGSLYVKLRSQEPDYMGRKNMSLERDRGHEVSPRQPLWGPIRPKRPPPRGYRAERGERRYRDEGGSPPPYYGYDHNVGGGNRRSLYRYSRPSEPYYIGRHYDGRREEYREHQRRSAAQRRDEDDDILYKGEFSALGYSQYR